MENASKALLIAAVVLVVIIIIAVGMKIYSSTTGTGKVATDTGKTISEKAGEATDIATYEITGKRPANPNIKYYEGETNNPKSQEDAGLGDTIKIGDEQFMIFSKTETEIRAMPKYNITLTEDHPKQSSSAGGVGFSTRPYWSKDENNNEIPGWNNGAVNDYIDINMNNIANKVQKYITAYKETLKDMGVNAEVRVAFKSDLESSEVSELMKNPGKSENFWLGSVVSYHYGTVGYVNNNGYFYTCDYYGKYRGTPGVRPIIIIPI